MECGCDKEKGLNGVCEYHAQLILKFHMEAVAAARDERKGLVYRLKDVEEKVEDLIGYIRRDRAVENDSPFSVDTWNKLGDAVEEHSERKSDLIDVFKLLPVDVIAGMQYVYAIYKSYHTYSYLDLDKKIADALEDAWTYKEQQRSEESRDERKRAE